MRIVKTSDRDTSALAQIRAANPPATAAQPPDYRDIVVVKPWGHEFLIFENSDVAIWFLHIQKGHATSMHCHPNKKTSLLLLKGFALCNTFFNRNYLNGPDAIVIDKGVFHSTNSLSPEGVYLIEVESPPDKGDLVRLDDQYGRKGKGYEGLSEMKKEHLGRYRHFFCSDPSPAAWSHDWDGMKIEFFTCLEAVPAEMLSSFSRGSFLSVCKGSIDGADGQPVLEVGDCAEENFLANFQGAKVAAGSTLMRVSAAGK